MSYTWQPEASDLTVRESVGIGTETPSQKLDVRGNSIIDGSLTINQNLTVGDNFQLDGNLQFTTGLAISEFSDDGNLTDSSSSTLPTERAVKTYVDNNLDTKAALNGSAEEDFAANNLSVNDSLTVQGAIATQQLSVEGNVSLGDQDSDLITINGILSSGHSSDSLQVNSAIRATGSVHARHLRADNITYTSQLSVTDKITGSLKIENNLTLGGKVGIGITTPEAELHVMGKLLGAAQDISGKALRICCGKTPEGSTNWEPYRGGTTGIFVDVDTSACGFIDTPIYIVNMHGNASNWSTTGGSSPYNRTNQSFRIYVRFSDGRELTPSFANDRGWHIQWIAIGN